MFGQNIRNRAIADTPVEMSFGPFPMALGALYERRVESAFLHGFDLLLFPAGWPVVWSSEGRSRV